MVTPRASSPMHVASWQSHDVQPLQANTHSTSLSNTDIHNKLWLVLHESLTALHLLRLARCEWNHPAIAFEMK